MQEARGRGREMGGSRCPILLEHRPGIANEGGKYGEGTVESNP